MDVRVLNGMLEARVRELADRRPAGNRDEHARRVEQDLPKLMRGLGLHPLPPRTDLGAERTGTVVRNGYRIEKWSYRSRPNVVATAHLYVPDGPGPFPVILRPHGHFEYKKSDSVIQASAISMALEGFASLVVDSPGFSWDDNPQNERRAMGTHDDAMLWMGTPVQGVAVWDLMRGLDLLTGREDLDLRRVAVVGESGGGTCATYAFALDARIQAAVLVVSAGSLEVMPHWGCRCNHIPGLLEVGDLADVIAMRAPSPVFLIAADEDDIFPPDSVRRTAEKVRAIYRYGKAEEAVRFESFPFGHDHNRRMREAANAFLREHLRGEPARPYAPEKRPITDGHLNPAPAETVDPRSEELRVLPEGASVGASLRELLEHALAEPYPAAFDATARLVRWGRYGHLAPLKPGVSLHLVEAPAPATGPETVALPVEELDARSACLMGFSVPEFLAQVVHLLLPGLPEGWEPIGLGGDVITSMIASMKTLVSQAQPEPGPERVTAEGPVASQVAHHLRLLRPGLQVTASHRFGSWREVLASDLPALAQPGARYLDFP